MKVHYFRRAPFEDFDLFTASWRPSRLVRWLLVCWAGLGISFVVLVLIVLRATR